MISFLDLLSQFTLSLTKTCNFKCGFCPLWQQSHHDVSTLVQTIKEGRFFEVYPRKRLVNVVGGDPFCFDSLPFVLSFLKSEGIKVRCWTNALFPIDLMSTAMPFVDQWMIYVPTTLNKEYQDITGYGHFQELEPILFYLAGESCSLVLHMPIKPYTIQDVPLVYEYAYYKKVSLYLHYSSQDDFSKDSIAYIRRFFRVKGVSVYHVTKPQSTLCAAFPTGAIESKRQLMRNVVSF